MTPLPKGYKAEPAKEGPDRTVAAGVKKSESGWVKEDGDWRYKDSKGNYAVNDWKTRTKPFAGK